MNEIAHATLGTDMPVVAFQLWTAIQPHRNWR